MTAFSSTWATTMSPFRAVVCGRITTKSPSAMWASIIESPRTEDVGIAARSEDVGHRQRLRRPLVGLDRTAGGDLADDRQEVSLRGGGLGRQLARQAELDRRGRGQPDRPRLGGTALEKALALEDLKVVVDRRGRGEPDRPRDLADRRGNARVRSVAAMKSRILTFRSASCLVIGPPCGRHRTERTFDCQGAAGGAGAAARGARLLDCAVPTRPARDRADSARRQWACWSDMASDDEDDGCPAATLNRVLAVALALLPTASRSAIYVRLIWALINDDRVPATRKALLGGALGLLRVAVRRHPRRRAGPRRARRSGGCRPRGRSVL